MRASLAQLFAEYSESHRHPTNRLTHKVAIPLIVFHVLAMLDWIHLVAIPATSHPLSVGMIAYAMAMIWYFYQDVKIGLILAVAMALCFPLGWATPWPVVVTIAVVGWLVQLAGHVVWEKKQPSFFTNLVHALVGPAFFVALLIHEWPRKQAATAA